MIFLLGYDYARREGFLKENDDIQVVVCSGDILGECLTQEQAEEIQEFEQKQSEAKKGKRHSVNRRIEQSARLQNISIDNWEGFASSKTDRLKASQEYKDWRRSVFERDNWTCQKCNKRGSNLHAHHIEPKSKTPEKVFDLQNGITLCASCHRQTDTYGVNNIGL